MAHLSKWLIWVPSADLPKPEDAKWDRPAWREIYDDLIAHQPLTHTLARCAEWFHKVAGHGEHLNWDPYRLVE